MPDYLHAPGVAQPRAAHTQTPAAEHARQAVRDYAARRNAERDAPPPLVTEHVPPWQRVEVDALSGSALAFAKAAVLGKGLAVEAWQAGDAVEVRVKGGTIRAWWKAGRTTGCLVDGKKASVTQAKAAL